MRGIPKAAPWRSLINDFIGDCTRGGFTSRTAYEYECRLSACARSLDMPIDRVTHRDLDRWLDAHAPSTWTRHNYRATLVSFFRWCVRHGHLLRNEAELTVRVRTPLVQARPLDGGEVLRAIAAAEPMMAAMMGLGALAGLRCCEIAVVRWEQVVLEGPTTRLSVRGKGGKDRTIPMHPDLAVLLDRLPRPRRGQVARRPDGELHSAATVSRHVGKYMRSAGIDGTPHQLRHTFGTRLYSATRDIYSVAQVLGHSDPKTTSIYAAWDVGFATAAVRALVL